MNKMRIKVAKYIKLSHIFQLYTKNSFSDSSDEANGGDAFEFVKKHSVESGFDEKAEVILKSALEERHGDSSSEDDDSGKTIFFFISLYLCNLSIYQRIFFCKPCSSFFMNLKF